MVAGGAGQHVERNLRHRSGRLTERFPFLELGIYSEPLTRYQRLFPGKVWVGLYEDFRPRTLEVFREICRFLDIDPLFTPI